MSKGPILIVRQATPLRSVTLEETLQVLAPEELALPRHDFEIDTRSFSESVEGGYWQDSARHIREQAARVSALATEVGAARILHFGIAEVPHLLALGCHLGDERLVEGYDYHRDQNSWRWPSAAEKLATTIEGLPHDVVDSPGDALLTVEISYHVDRREVTKSLPTAPVADISIRPITAASQRPGVVQSRNDVLHVRDQVRSVFANLARTRPSLRQVHLLLAAPTSVCLAVGQELRIRNTFSIQTYRYRAGEPPRHRRALRLSSDRTEDTRPRGEPNLAEFTQLQKPWKDALQQLIDYSIGKRDDCGGEGVRWNQNLRPFELSDPQLLPGLPAIWKIVKEGDGIADSPRSDEYAFSKGSRQWEFSYDLLRAFETACDRDDSDLLSAGRLFFFHEYLHDSQVLTKYTADQVGRFANCLEKIDYIADTYALLHELDHCHRTNRSRVGTSEKALAYLLERIDLIIGGFWAFDHSLAPDEWQERRLRRYLNWYWRRVQVREAPDLDTAVRTLSQPPTIEISGFQFRTGQGRLFVSPLDIRPNVNPEIGIVLEDHRFLRLGTTADLDISKLMRAFARARRDEIDQFFSTLFEHARARGDAAVFPVDARGPRT